MIELAVSRVAALPAWYPYLCELQRLHNLTDKEQDEQDLIILGLIDLVGWVHEHRDMAPEELHTGAVHQATLNPFLKPFAKQIGRDLVAKMGLS